MRSMITILLLVALPCAAQQTDDNARCTQRQKELSVRAATFEGEAMIKRLIEADLKRASKEQAEGDADECLEALDHAEKLLDGKI